MAISDMITLLKTNIELIPFLDVPESRSKNLHVETSLSLPICLFKQLDNERNKPCIDLSLYSCIFFDKFPT